MPKRGTEKKKQPKFLILTGVAFQMGLTIYLGVALGKYLDERFFSEGKLMLIICTILALVISFYNLNRQVNRINNND